MKQEDKDLLMKDLCMRLPYGVKGIITFNGDKDIFTVKGIINILFLSDTECCHVEDFKPYLIPISSMTEEQLDELKEYSGLKYSASLLELVNWTDECTTLEFWLEETPADIIIKVFDWLNRNHFDYRDLITRGLAIDCTNLNIY